MRGDFLPAFYFETSEAMIAWSKTGNHIRGSLPRFMREFGKEDFLPAFYFQISEANDSLE